MTCLPLLVVGGILAYALPFPQALLAAALSSAILGGLSILTARVGVETRLTTLLISERTLGRVGARCLSVLILLGFLGWWGFQTEIMAQTIDTIAHNAGYFFPRWLTIGGSGLVMIVTSVIGSKAIGKVAYVLVPIKVTVLALLVAHMPQTFSLSEILHFTPPASGMNFGAVVGMLTGAMMVAVLGYPDLARFLRTRTDTTKAMVAVFSTMTLIYAVAMVLSIAHASHNIVQVLPTLGFAPLALLLVFFATWAANDKNLYAACIGIAAFTHVLQRWQITALAGLAGIVLAYVGIFERLVAVLTLLGVMSVPVAAVYVVDYFIHPQLYKKAAPPKVAVRWLPISAWFAGAVTGIITSPANGYGLGLLNLSTVPTIDAFAVALLVMLAGQFFSRK